jgi:aspartyl-tRNA(Asn)/glutamyl-tRNA(Gln) amidotransferase subunit A
VPDYEAAIGKSLKGHEDRHPERIPLDGMHAGNRKLWEQGAAWLKAAGAELVEVSLPHTKYALAGLLHRGAGGSLVNLARYDGVRYGLRVPGRHRRDV